MLVNTRILQAPLTGVQRYLSAVLNAWPGARPEPVAPPPWAARGLRAHVWEQSVLPLRARGQLLWSPVHSGPLGFSHQVVTVHDVVPLDHPEWLNKNFARWYRFMLPRLVHTARHVIAISEFTRQRIVATTGLSADKISVIANGVGAAFQPVPASGQASMRRVLGLPDGPYALSVGSLEPRKNLASALKAWQRALARLPEDWHLVVVGAAGDPRVFSDSERADWPERVVRLGRVEDEWLPALYSAAECFIYLSLYEGFGLPPLEAMACGTAVLISDIDVMNEVVGDYSTNCSTDCPTNCAIKVSPLDIDDIANGLLTIAHDPDLRRSMGERALQRAADFGWEKTASQTQALLQRFE